MSLYNQIIDLQKLHQAWNRVRKNKPAAGVDHITFDQFEDNKSAELRKLNKELKEYTYQVLPVKRVKLYKGDKEREIVLYAMRDKVIQQSIATELNHIYDPLFSSRSFAYRNNKSALNAVNQIDGLIRTDQYKYVAKLDILHYFDSILWGNLERVLKKRIREEDVIELIQQNVKGQSLEEMGELAEKHQGIYQGSAVSPILSNIYLMEFDLKMEKMAEGYFRYSDDIFLLADTKEFLQKVLGQMKVELECLGLRLNDKKSICALLEEGVDFLGYHFSGEGKAIPAKAEESLSERLEFMWLTSADLTMEEKLGKALEIIGGWEQYFREQRLPSSIIEYTALAYAARGKEDFRKKLINERSRYVNIYKDIACYLAGIWKENDVPYLELLEYEQFYQIWQDMDSLHKIDVGMAAELLVFYRREIIEENQNNAVELMQLYTDLGQYEKAKFWSDKKIGAGEKIKYLEMNMQRGGNSVDIQFTSSGIERIMKLFIGREDLYCKEVLGKNRHRSYEMQAVPLSKQILVDHLRGKETIGTYIQRPNATVHYMIVDIDISKKIMLQYERGDSEYQAYMEKAWKIVNKILKLYHEFGIQGYPEYSGCRGYHVWLFFQEWIPVRYANMLAEVLQAKLGEVDEGIGIEIFPNKTRIKPGKFGQAVKVPYGIHTRTEEQSYFLDTQGKPMEELDAFLDSIATFSLSAIKKILAANTRQKVQASDKMVEADLEEFGSVPENIMQILEKCNLMRYLCHKSLKTSYLTHFERLSILYVFGHMGEIGQEFVHQVMSYTLNYQYNVTDKFIKRIPAKPVSCIKLREQYKMITAEYGCNCNFHQKTAILHLYCMPYPTHLICQRELPCQPAGHIQKKRRKK